MNPDSPAAWLETPLGHYVLDSELKYIDEMVADVFGFNAVQLGLPEHDFLRASRIPFKCRVAPTGPAALRSGVSPRVPASAESNPAARNAPSVPMATCRSRAIASIFCCCRTCSNSA